MWGGVDAVARHIESSGWSDGLPVVPPTEKRVTAMLEGFDADETLGTVPPGYGDATIEILAANSVMAGCAPPMFPVVVAALEALLQPQFNLGGVQATTHPVSPMLVVHGPIAREIGINGGSGVFGPGFAANATIGRAVRLILLNVGLARPGAGDLATQGTPAKFSFCITENVIDSPWPEYHATQGFDPNDDAVTVLGVEGPHNCHDHQSNTAVRYANIMADVMRGQGPVSWIMSAGNDWAIVLGPEFAQMLHRDGWTRHDLQMYLFFRASRPVKDIMWGPNWAGRDWPAWMEGLAEDPDARVPPVRHPDDMKIFVAGGPGKQSAVVPAFGNSAAVTWPVRRSSGHKGTPA